MNSIYACGNHLYRKSRYADSYFIYDYLHSMHPEFPGYARWRKISGKKMAREALRSKKSLTVKLIRAADVLFREKQHSQLIELISISPPVPDALLLKAMLSLTAEKNHHDWLFQLNEYLKTFNLNKLKFNSNSEASFTNILNSISADNTKKLLHTTPSRSVTVMMSCFNAESTIDYALRSLHEQTYPNIQVVVVDDNSTDNSQKIVKAWSEKDSRIKLLTNSSNSGTYISRNRVLKEAQTDYFTVLDSDDFSLPDRIERQVNFLNTNPDALACEMFWLRMSASGEFIYKHFADSYLHEAVATMMMRTQAVRNTVGYWDSVRFAADTEYKHRILKNHGAQAVMQLPEPAALALYHDNSLTRDPVTGISEDSGLSPVRIQYRQSWENWHKNSDHCFLGYAASARKFKAPVEMIVNL